MTKTRFMMIFRTKYIQEMDAITEYRIFYYLIVCLSFGGRSKVGYI
jgi:hypothetical protein